MGKGYGGLAGRRIQNALLEGVTKVFISGCQVDFCDVEK